MKKREDLKKIANIIIDLEQESFFATEYARRIEDLIRDLSIEEILELDEIIYSRLQKIN